MEDKLKILPRELEECLREGNIEECKRVFSQCELNGTSWSGSNVFSLVPMPREFAFWAKEQGADIHFRDRIGQTPIFETARMDGDISLLTELGADVNDVRSDGCTPLHIAATRGCKKAVRALIKAGAKVDARTNDYNGFGYFTVLEKVLYEASLSSMKKYDICKILLDKGAEMTERSLQFVSAFSETFHRHNAKKKNMKSYENHLAALEKLCKMFEVEMISESPAHDGVSPVLVTDFLSFKNNFEELWEFLVPPRGQAQTAQGEVIRIAGRISDELWRNGGMNWDEDYRKMLDSFGEYCHSGNPFYWMGDSVEEIIDALKDGDVNDLRIEQLRTCAVRWVENNPEVMPLLKTDYAR